MQIWPDFKTCYKATVIMIASYQHKDRQTDHWNRIDHPKGDPHIYGNGLLTVGKIIKWRKGSLFQ